MKNELRRLEHQKNLELEEILSYLNNNLEEIEIKLISHFKENNYPIILIFGNARCGTTLLFQWFASLGEFAYPSNIISRFYKAPFIGALIHKIFIDYDKNKELFLLNKIYFQSILGKTKGPGSPHEFWYFWRRFFSFGESQRINKEDLDKVNVSLLKKELASIENVFDKPLVLKGIILNWHIEYLNKIFDKVLFIQMVRNPIYNMQSLIKARIDFFGNENHWYSFKPPQYVELKEKEPLEQVAGQVFHTNFAIKKQFEKINEEKKLVIEYEKFCENPNSYYEKIYNKLSLQGCKKLKPQFIKNLFFKNNNKIIIEGFNFQKAKNIYSKYDRH